MEGLIVPSKFYGILAAGRPIIYVGSKQGEIPALLHAGSCGVTVPIGQGQTLARQISAWADDRESCHRLGHAARRLFDARFEQSLALTAWYHLMQERQ